MDSTPVKEHGDHKSVQIIPKQLNALSMAWLCPTQLGNYNQATQPDLLEHVPHYMFPRVHLAESRTWGDVSCAMVLTRTRGWSLHCSRWGLMPSFSYQYNTVDRMSNVRKIPEMECTIRLVPTTMMTCLNFDSSLPFLPIDHIYSFFFIYFFFGGGWGWPS